MDQFRLLGRRDVFGILLPGTILVFAGAYALFGVLALLHLPIKNLLDQQFLLAVVLFVTAYLVGSILRLHAVSNFDTESSRYRVRAWRKKHRAIIEAGCESEFEKRREELARGDGITDVPTGFNDQLFDGWLRRVDEFPYHAWLNRMWRAQGFCGVLDFFHSNYKTSMWSESRASSRIFLFNYCKLSVIGGGGTLADEVVMAEGLTRFFAGAAIALRMSTWLLGASLVAQLLLVAALTFAPEWGVKPALSVEWTSQGFYLALTLILMFAFQWVCRQILKRFRGVRFREVVTVYHAFHLHSVLHPELAAERTAQFQGDALESAAYHEVRELEDCSSEG